MDTILCPDCGGYGEVYTNWAFTPQEEPDYRLTSCIPCHGLGHRVPGTSKNDFNAKIAAQALKGAIQAIEKRDQRLKEWLAKPFSERQKIYNEAKSTQEIKK